MITLDYLTLKAFFEENKKFFVGARLQKIQQPTRRDFLLTIRAQGETRRLYINISPQIYHMCFITDETLSKRNIFIPKKPPMFCMLLRKYLEGAKISGVKLPEKERIFEMFFEAYNELNEKIKLCLAIELMGKYSNVILYNTDTNIIIGCAHNVGSEKSRERELAGTLPYIYPQKQSKADILSYNGMLDYDLLNESFAGISVALQNQFKRNSVSLDKIKRFVALDYPLSPSYNNKEFSLYSELIDSPVVCGTVNQMLDEYYSYQQEKILIRALRLKLKNSISPQYKKQKLLVNKLSQQLSKKDNAVKYKNYADLIMANLYNNKDYIKELYVYNWEDNRNIKIPLDERRSLKENAQKYYILYSKSKSAQEKLEVLKSDAQNTILYYDTILYSISNAESLPELYEVLSECEDLGIVQNKSEHKEQKTLTIEELNINGCKVYIGKNNKQNDYIISKLASPNDIWFHAQNCPGSHVLLKVFESKDIDDDTIFRCAKLAKEHSAASNNTKAGVIFTKRKYLKKPPKSNPGYVTYKNEKEIVVS